MKNFTFLWHLKMEKKAVLHEKKRRTWAPFFFLPDMKPVSTFLFLCELRKISSFFGILKRKKGGASWEKAKNMGSFLFPTWHETSFYFSFLVWIMKNFTFLWHLKTEKKAVLHEKKRRMWAPFFFLPDMKLVSTFLLLCELWKISRFFGILKRKKRRCFMRKSEEHGLLSFSYLTWNQFLLFFSCVNYEKFHVSLAS